VELSGLEPVAQPAVTVDVMHRARGDRPEAACAAANGSTGAAKVKATHILRHIQTQRYAASTAVVSLLLQRGSVLLAPSLAAHEQTQPTLSGELAGHVATAVLRNGFSTRVSGRVK
jgi:hypothetical protein